MSAQDVGNLQRRPLGGTAQVPLRGFHDSADAKVQ
jgi:hypothetical protein